MEKTVPFIKMHGTGNDFILINNVSGYLSGAEEDLIRRLCQRHFGIGADGLMLLRVFPSGEVHLQYFNADGRPAEMCGNGARCAVQFAHRLYPRRKNFILKVAGKEYAGEVRREGQVRIHWSGAPAILDSEPIQSTLPEEFARALFVNSGVPHLVLECKTPLTDAAVATWGRHFRHHSFFAPAGTNVDFVRLEKGNFQLRTYERGVEAETLSCGTGAVAAAAALTHWGVTTLPVELHTPGGMLWVGQAPHGIWLEGPVRQVFTGEFRLSDFNDPE